MTKTIGSVGTVVITFFVTLILNTAVNYYARDKGTISVSEPMVIGERESRVVTIENYSSESLDGLVLEVPREISISGVSTKPAMKVEEISSAASGKTKLLAVSNIHPRYVSRIFITSPEGEFSGAVKVSNYESSGLSLKYDERLESPLKFALFAALFVAILYAIVEAVSLYVAAKERDKLHKKIDDLRRESDQATKDIRRKAELMDKKANGLSDLLAKQRLLLQARIYDYSKELSFWRNTVKTFLIQRGCTDKSAEELVEHVTSSLKTFGTKSNDEHSYESMKIAARWLSESEKEAGVGERRSIVDG